MGRVLPAVLFLLLCIIPIAGSFGLAGHRNTTYEPLSPSRWAKQAATSDPILRIVLMLLVGIILHEAGHIIIYTLTTGYIPTISLVFLPDVAIAVNYPVASPMPLLVTAGGLIFTAPLLLLLIGHRSRPESIVIIAAVLYALTEILL